MRWEKLFDDLESQLERELSVEETDLAAEDERLRLGRLTLRDRLMALHREGHDSIRLVLLDGTRHTVRVDTFGRDWCSGVDQVAIASGRSRRCIVPLAGIAGIPLEEDEVWPSLAQQPIPEPATSLSARLGLAFVLRDLCRRRYEVELDTLDGPLRGTIDRVGGDHIDVALHESGAPRRRGTIREIRLVPHSRIVLVRF